MVDYQKTEVYVSSERLISPRQLELLFATASALADGFAYLHGSPPYKFDMFVGQPDVIKAAASCVHIQ